MVDTCELSSQVGQIIVVRSLMLIKCGLLDFDAIFFYGQLIGKIDNLKYRYWDLTVHVPGRQMHRAV